MRIRIGGMLFVSVMAFAYALKAQEPVTEQESATVAIRFADEMDQAADIRKLNAALLHSQFPHPPCRLMMLIPEKMCGELTGDEIREFYCRLLNVTYMMFEHQLSLPSGMQPSDESDLYSSHPADIVRLLHAVRG